MKKLLLVDADPLSLCVLDVSLRKAGYQVTTAVDGLEALEKVDSNAPHLVLTDTRLPKLDGYALVRTLRERPEASDTPVVFLGGQESLEDRRRAHELGVEDYLAKPVFLAELIARINLVFARRTREHVAGGHSSKFDRNRFIGSTQDFALVDLLRNFEVTRRTGVIHLRNALQEAHVYFREGKAIDAELGPLRGEEAVFRALMWSEASFDIELKPIPNEDVVSGTTSALVQRGMQRVDEWVRLCEQVQSLAALLDIHAPELLERLSRLTAVPDSLNGLLRLSPPPDVRAALPAMAATQAPVHRQPAAAAAGVVASERGGITSPVVAGLSPASAPRAAPVTSPVVAAAVDSADQSVPAVVPSVSRVAAAPHA
ncbi:MAG: response regulator, partial [Polyangiaceae bacterium]